METAYRPPRGRRHNLSLRQLAPIRPRRDESPTPDPKHTDEAFASFYREHVTAVYQYALAVLSNPADAEDVTQQTFLNAYRAFQRGEQPHTPHNWLIKIAHNVCRMRWRQSARRPQEFPLEDAREPASSDDEKPSLDEVLAALGRLPFNQRAAIVMRELEDRSYAEIAEVLGTSVSAVEALLFRARTNLRAHRTALGTLAFVPVPASLSSFFGGSGGGFVAAGGVAVGSEIVLKAAAVVATGVVLGGVGFKGADAVATAKAPAANVPQLQRDAAPSLNASDRLARAAAASRARVTRAQKGWPTAGRAGRDRVGPRNNDARFGDTPAESAAAAAAAAPAPAAGGAASQSPAPAAAAAGVVAAPAPPPAVDRATTTVDDAVGALPAPAPAPAPPPLPVPIPTVPLPPVPVTVPAVTVPSLP